MSAVGNSMVNDEFLVLDNPLGYPYDADYWSDNLTSRAA